MLNNPMQLIGMLQGSPNPMGIIHQFFGPNPRYNEIMRIVQGKNPQQLEQYVRNLYKSQNVDLSQTANQFGLNIQ